MNKKIAVIGSGFGGIAIWNVDGTVCTVNMDTSTAVNAVNYLTGARTNYSILTVQDTSIITNNLITASALANPTPYSSYNHCPSSWR